MSSTSCNCGSTVVESASIKAEELLYGFRGFMNNSRKTVKELQNLCSGKATKINSMTDLAFQNKN
jgi:hypothetical protein